MSQYIKHIAIMNYFDYRDFSKFLFYDKIYASLIKREIMFDGINPNIDVQEAFPDLFLSQVPHWSTKEFEVLYENNLLVKTPWDYQSNGYLKSSIADHPTNFIKLVEDLSKTHQELTELHKNDKYYKDKEFWEFLSNLNYEETLPYASGKFERNTLVSDYYKLLSEYKNMIPILFLNLKQKASPITENYFPVLEHTKTKPYSHLTSGYVMNLVGVSIPELPIRALLSFKQDNLDKLRRFRVAIDALINTHNHNLSYVVEELSLSLIDYNKSVARYCKKKSFSSMHFALNIIKDIPKITSGDFSSISKTIEFKESQIIDTQ